MLQIKKSALSHSSDEILITNLQRLMQEHNLTEAELSRQARIPQPTLHKVLTGKTDDPRISTIQALADFFCIGIDKLYSPHSDLNDREKPNLATQAIPIISWEDCLKGEDFIKRLHVNNWEQWVVTEYMGKHMYSLRTKPSMEPRFAKNSILVINPDLAPIDGNFVIVQYPNTSEATLRRILIDGPIKKLALIQDGNGDNQEPLSNDINILGIVTQVKLDF